MVPEILGVPVSAHHMQQRPASYSTFSDHAAQVRTNAAVRKTKPRPTPGRSRSSDNIDIGAGTSEAVSMDTGGQKPRRRRARQRQKKSASMEVETAENSALVTREDRAGVGDVVSLSGTKSEGEEAEDSMVVTPVIPTRHI